MKNNKFFYLLIAAGLMLCFNQASAAKINQRDTTLKPIDTALYDSLMRKIANGNKKWAVKTKVYPLPGAIFPFHRVVAFYGNLYSKNMGVLGEYAPKLMLKKLQDEVKNWQKADTAIKVIPALHYICLTAQAYPGKNNYYSLRMPFKHIDSVLHMAASINAIVFLDMQIGQSTLEREIPLLEKYLKMPNVHLGIDPEFAMKDGSVPGKRIGTFDADDVNYATKYLAELVKKYNLPPKIFILHRFTRKMVTNYKNIKIRPEVQFVMDMDGWGGPQLKRDSYKYFIADEPVQFTGFKLFYKNDIKNPPKHMLTPKEVLELKPAPVYIQYQ